MDIPFVELLILFQVDRLILSIVIGGLNVWRKINFGQPASVIETLQF